ncbi:MAG: hypothetical protein IKB20_03070 [Clostridia bacterium]|nr:hypothetical protein [Clostridia bacterium]
MSEKTKQEFGGFRQTLSSLKTLTAMQLKEKMDRSKSKSFAKRFFPIIYFILGFVAVTAICFLLFKAANILSIFSLVGDIPVSVMAIVFGSMTLLSIVFTVFGLVNSLYLSRDNLVLLTFPVKPSIVFLSKLLVYYIYELRKNFLFLIPFFVAYGIVKNLAVFYFVWVLFLFLFVSLLPVLIAAILSIPALFVCQLCRKLRILQYILVLAGIALVAWGVMAAINIIPDNIDLVATWGTTYWKIQDFLAAFEDKFGIVVKFTQLIIGKRVGMSNVLFTKQTLPHLLILIGVLAALIGLCFALSQPLFYKMASKPFEYRKRVFDKSKPNRKTPVFLSALKKEWIVGLRDNSILSLFVQTVVVLPIALELLNKLYSAMDTRFFGQQLAIAFNLLIVLLFMLSGSIRIASAYSKDGSTAYLNKVQPSTYGKLLFAKLVIPLLVGFVGVAVTTYVFSTHSGLSTRNNILFGATVYLFYATHLLWSAEMDLMNPQYAQYATFANQTNNPNENKSTILCFVLSFLVAGATLLLSLENVSAAWIKVSLIGLAFCVFKTWSYFIKIKVFYKEK